MKELLLQYHQQSKLLHVNQPQSLPAADEFDTFYESLSYSGTKPAILSLIPKYSSSYVPKRLLPTFPQPLQLLHLPEYMDLEYHELLKVCETLHIEITKETALTVEKETRLQSSSKLWFRYRAGRVTASRIKAVLHSDN